MRHCSESGNAQRRSAPSRLLTTSLRQFIPVAAFMATCQRRYVPLASIPHDLSEVGAQPGAHSQKKWASPECDSMIFVTKLLWNWESQEREKKHHGDRRPCFAADAAPIHSRATRGQEASTGDRSSWSDSALIPLTFSGPRHKSSHGSFTEVGGRS